MTDWHKRLEEVTGYQTFKPGQLASLEALDRQENVVAILPTGGGKSLIYQINQYNESGVTLIISPLISLMQDQVSQLQRMGLGRGIALNSTYDRGEQAYILSQLSIPISITRNAPERSSNQGLTTDGHSIISC